MTFLEKLKSGDKATIREIYENVFPKFNSWVLSNSGNREDAFDIFQEVLESILIRTQKHTGRLDGLIIKLGKYRWIDKLRREKKRQEVRKAYFDRLIIELNVEEGMIQKEAIYIKYMLMNKTFGKISELCQQILFMISQGRKLEEIAESLSFKSMNTLYRRKAACIQRWSELIKSENTYQDLIQ